MKTINVGDKTYVVIKKYPNFTLCEDKSGFRTCFDDFDLGLIKKKTCIEWRRERGISVYPEDKKA